MRAWAGSRCYETSIFGQVSGRVPFARCAIFGASFLAHLRGIKVVAARRVLVRGWSISYTYRKVVKSSTFLCYGSYLLGMIML